MARKINLILWLATVIFVAFIFTLDAKAKDVQWSQGYTGGCLDPSQRVDGTPLPPAEIAKVEYYLDQTDGDITTPELTIIMNGGCRDTFIDTKVLSTGTYYAYGRAFDTDGLVSDVSVSTDIVITKAKPKPPSGIR